MHTFPGGPSLIRFSVGVGGASPLRQRFIEMVKTAYPRAVVYDRQEEAERDDARAARPRHPEVAEIEAVFGRKMGSELLTLRSFIGHRYLNCTAPPAGSADQVERFLRAAIAELPELLSAT
jgi:hypothetical protein